MIQNRKKYGLIVIIMMTVQFAVQFRAFSQTVPDSTHYFISWLSDDSGKIFVDNAIITVPNTWDRYMTIDAQMGKEPGAIYVISCFEIGITDCFSVDASSIFEVEYIIIFPEWSQEWLELSPKEGGCITIESLNKYIQNFVGETTQYVLINVRTIK